MNEQKHTMHERISEIKTSLSHIINNTIEMSSEEETSSPLLQKNHSLSKLISEIKTSLLFQLPDNCIRILDFLSKYTVMTARNLQNFLNVSKRQIYYYLTDLREIGLITYTERVVSDGPPTRFHHFPGTLSREELQAAESLEKSYHLERLKDPQNQETLELIHYKCFKCMREFQEQRSDNPDNTQRPTCPYCGERKKIGHKASDTKTLTTGFSKNILL